MNYLSTGFIDWRVPGGEARCTCEVPDNPSLAPRSGAPGMLRWGLLGLLAMFWKACRRTRRDQLLQEGCTGLASPSACAAVGDTPLLGSPQLPCRSDTICWEWSWNPVQDQRRSRPILWGFGSDTYLMPDTCPPSRALLPLLSRAP